MKRKILKTNTRISFNGIEATVVGDDGGDHVLVIEDGGTNERTEWAWKQGRRTCKVIAEPEPHTYKEVVAELIKRISDSMDADEVKKLVEHGLMGVREMSNEELARQWLVWCGKPLEITDPKSNSYRPCSKSV